MYPSYSLNIDVSDIKTGAFSRLNPDGSITLSDGEELVFSLSVANPKAKNLAFDVSWLPPNPLPADNRPDLTTTDDVEHPGGLLSLKPEPGLNGFFRLKHAEDRQDDNYILITRDLFYNVTTTDYSYTFYIYNGKEYVVLTNPILDSGQGASATNYDRAEPTVSINTVLYSAKDGEVDAWNAFFAKHGLSAWKGEEKTFSYSTASSYAQPGFYSPGKSIPYLPGRATSLAAYYESATPYVIHKTAFRNNPIYYYKEQTMHKYAVPTCTKSQTATASISGGKIHIAYRLANGEQKESDVRVTVEKRNCEAYSKNMWTASSYGGYSGWVLAK